MKTETPFPTTGYTGPENFCDRLDETTKIIGLLEGGQSITLISIRRLGKTALIRHVQHQLKGKWLTVYLDILNSENFNDLLNELATAVVQAVQEATPFGKKAWNFFRSIRPTIQFNDLSGLPSLSFDVQPEIAKQNIHAIFHLLEEQNLPVVIAIDEFQQITNYPEQHVDAWLRTIIQQLNNVSFIFSGSQHHIMTELFNNPKRPFFSSTGLLRLSKIDKDDYVRFIQEKFDLSSKTISGPIIEGMLKWADLHTYYVQVLCNRIYHNGIKNITEPVWKAEAYQILQEQEIAYFNFRNLLTKRQWELLRAVALEEVVTAPTAQKFLNTYNLGSSAAVLRSLDALIQKEMIYFDYDEEGKKFYKVVDVFLIRWFQNNA
jgi:hypothetical protein